MFKAIREQLNTLNHSTEITKADFARTFNKTKERLVFTFQGWDGKSYDGETCTAFTYRTNIPGFENARFIKVGKPDKDKSTEKIDGIVATIMALDRAIRCQDATSVYDTRGLLFI